MFKITMALRSGLKRDVTLALQTLLYISNDASTQLLLEQNLDILKLLVDFCQIGWSSRQWSCKRPRTYVDLYSREESQSRLGLFQSEPFEEGAAASNEMELSLLASTVVRNLSMIQENQLLLGRNKQLVSFVHRSMVDDVGTEFSLCFRKNSLVLLQNIGHSLDELSSSELHDIVRVLSDFMETNYGGNGLASCSNAWTSTLYSEYGWMALDALTKLSTNARLTDAFESLDQGLMTKVLRLLVSELPMGVLHRLEKQSGESSPLLSQRWYEMVSVETALLCLLNLCTFVHPTRKLLVAVPNAVTILTRHIAGICWANTPVYIRDPVFAKSALGNGLASLYEARTPVEKEKVQQFYAEVSKMSGMILLRLAQDPECRQEISTSRFKTIGNSRSSFWGHSTRWQHGYDVDSSTEVLHLAREEDPECGDMEGLLLGMSLNPKVPHEIHQLISELLFSMTEGTRR